ncbi:GPCR, family 3 domain-containing protein [Rozella allomycis CSF55]|uniref:GPCR, family 3 domain-containing protein n=1 Tax=Rozella allomycis (strain CSF55) TaxID=988480 RepID=A0A075B5C6_ROZAC|nr:GPCR, family 3 domain-containing protein [Rozella allomycis CSF55]|eukprot:EPZ36966.1 GPCR, family 3 domain-containing protein [Rozella allomycis CSF55]
MMILLLLFYASCVISLSPNGTIPINIGISLGITSYQTVFIDMINAIYLRADQLNQNASLIHPNATIRLTFKNSDLDSTKIVPQMIEFNNENMLGIIGAGYSSLSTIESLVLQSFKLPMCCGSSTNPTLGDKTKYGNFFRTSPSDTFQADAMAQYVKNSGWKMVSLIASNDNYGQDLANQFAITAKQLGIQILSRVSFYSEDSKERILSAVQATKSVDSRIIVYFGFAVDYVKIINVAKEQGIYGAGYAWLASDGVITVFDDPIQKNEIEGSIIFIAKEGQGPIYDEIKSMWPQGVYQTNSPIAINTTSTIPGVYSMAMASCLDLLIHGLDRIFKSSNLNSIDNLINKTYHNQIRVPETFQFNDLMTPSGNVILDANGERIGDYSVYNGINGTAQLVATWSNGEIINSGIAMIYPGGQLKKPKDAIDPYEVAQYVDSNSPVGTLSHALGSIGLISIFATFSFYFLFRKNQILMRSSIKVSYVSLLSLAIAFLQLFVMPGLPTKASCVSDSFLLAVAFSLYYGNTFAKTVRLYRLFNIISTTEGSKWTDSKVLLLGSSLTIPVIFIVIIWNAVDSPSPVVKMGSSRHDYYWTCSSSSPDNQITFLTLILVYCGLILLMNLFMALKTRHVPAKFQETKILALSIYNVTMVLAFVIPMLVSNVLGFQASFLVKLFIIAYIAFFNLISSFLFKLFLIFSGNSEHSRPATKASKLSLGKIDGEMSKDWKAFTKVQVKSSGLFSEFKLKALVLSTDGNSIHLLEYKRNNEDANISPGGISISWFVKYLRSFQYSGNNKSFLAIIVSDGDKYNIQFADKESFQKWSKIFENWQAKVAGMTIHNTSQFLVSGGFNSSVSNVPKQ